MTDTSNVAVVDDDFAATVPEAAGSKAAAWGGKGLNAGIAVAGVLTVAGLPLLVKPQPPQTQVRPTGASA